MEMSVSVWVVSVADDPSGKFINNNFACHPHG